MKKLILAAIGVIAFGSAAMGVSQAATEPLMLGEHSPLFTANGRQIIPMYADTNTAAKEFAQAWADQAREGEFHKDYAGDLFKHFVKGRLEFYQEAHNWKTPAQAEELGQEDVIPSYGYVKMAALADKLYAVIDDIEAEEGNDVSQEKVMAGINNALAEAVLNTDNRELQYYLQDLVWFAAHQTVKEMGKHSHK